MKVTVDGMHHQRIGARISHACAYGGYEEKKRSKSQIGRLAYKQMGNPSTTNPTAAAGNIRRDRYGVNPPPKMKPNPSEAYKIPTP